MKLTKLCKVYVGIGMVYAGVLFAGVREIDKEKYDHFSTESKVAAFSEVVLTWPKYATQFIKGVAKGFKFGYNFAKEVEKASKESTNESDT